MLDTMLLSRCDYLLKPASAVSEWAIYFNPALGPNSFTLGLPDGEGVGQPQPRWMAGLDPQ